MTFLVDMKHYTLFTHQNIYFFLYFKIFFLFLSQGDHHIWVVFITQRLCSCSAVIHMQYQKHLNLCRCLRFTLLILQLQQKHILYGCAYVKQTPLEKQNDLKLQRCTCRWPSAVFLSQVALQRSSSPSIPAMGYRGPGLPHAGRRCERGPGGG